MILLSFVKAPPASMEELIGINGVDQASLPSTASRSSTSSPSRRPDDPHVLEMVLSRTHQTGQHGWMA